MLLVRVANFSLRGKHSSRGLIVQATLRDSPDIGVLTVERLTRGRWVRTRRVVNVDPTGTPSFVVPADGTRYRVTFGAANGWGFQGSFLMFTAPRSGGFKTPYTRTLGLAAMVPSLPR